MRGWDWLTDSQRARVVDAVPRTLSQHAWRSDLGTSWPGTLGRREPPDLCQYCHGAPAWSQRLLTRHSRLPSLRPSLLDGGRYTWAVGPLAKGSNLCHGTGGNGYAFLKLYRRTTDPVWLERARAFAMTSIAQCRETREELGRGRYTLWTGDIGLAVYLWDCPDGYAAVPDGRHFLTATEAAGRD
jgi:hypothetical protein